MACRGNRASAFSLDQRVAASWRSSRARHRSRFSAIDRHRDGDNVYRYRSDRRNAGLLLLTRFSKNPDRLFITIAVVLLVLSFIPNILTGMSPQSAPFPGVTWPAIGTLMLMHLPPALLSIYFLTRR